MMCFFSTRQNHAVLAHTCPCATQFQYIAPVHEWVVFVPHICSVATCFTEALKTRCWKVLPSTSMHAGNVPRTACDNTVFSKVSISQVSKVRMTQSVPKFRCFHGQLVKKNRNGIHNFFRSKNPFQTLSQKPRPRSKEPAAP